MTIHSNYPKITKLEKSNGIFIIFNDYEYEDDFPCFLDFLELKLNVAVSKPTQFPYSLATEITLPEGVLTAMFHGDTGCCVRVAPGEQSLANYLVYACYGGQNTEG
jgi:hypothetical protein